MTITSLMPGPTETEFFERADMEDTKVGSEEKDDPAEVARQGYDALMAGEEKVVAGSFKNKAQTVAGKLIPDSKRPRCTARWPNLARPVRDDPESRHRKGRLAVRLHQALRPGSRRPGQVPARTPGPTSARSRFPRTAPTSATFSSPTALPTAWQAVDYATIPISGVYGGQLDPLPMMKIANSSESSKKGGGKSGSKSQKRVAGREGGKKSGKSS